MIWDNEKLLSFISLGRKFVREGDNMLSWYSNFVIYVDILRVEKCTFFSFKSLAILGGGSRYCPTHYTPKILERWGHFLCFCSRQKTLDPTWREQHCCLYSQVFKYEYHLKIFLGGTQPIKTFTTEHGGGGHKKHARQSTIHFSQLRYLIDKLSGCGFRPFRGHTRSIWEKTKRLDLSLFLSLILYVWWFFNAKRPKIENVFLGTSWNHVQSITVIKKPLDSW